MQFSINSSVRVEQKATELDLSWFLPLKGKRLTTSRIFSRGGELRFKSIFIKSESRLKWRFMIIAAISRFFSWQTDIWHSKIFFLSSHRKIRHGCFKWRKFLFLKSFEFISKYLSLRLFIIDEAKDLASWKPKN